LAILRKLCSAKPAKTNTFYGEMDERRCPAFGVWVAFLKQPALHWLVKRPKQIFLGALGQAVCLLLGLALG
jgi:hypothetical protein